MAKTTKQITDELNENLDALEHLKTESSYLRGTIEESLEDPLTGVISDDDVKLLKFHGSYQQDDQDVHDERHKQKLEPAYVFMIHVRLPGGKATPEQWIAMDDISNNYANHTLKLTIRQAFQFHGILKRNLKSSMKKINGSVLDTTAVCRDVNRNTMYNPNPYQSNINKKILDYTTAISDHLLPKMNAYHEVWLDGRKVLDSKEEVEPVYGEKYLLRKFKIGIAVPPSNDVDVFLQDVSLVAIVENDELVGFNVAIGGGMGMAHGNLDTYPQIEHIAGFVPEDKVMDVCEVLLTIQRDLGNHSSRKNARFKCTVDRSGVDNIVKRLNTRLGWKISEARGFKFEHNDDRLGWVGGEKGVRSYTSFIQNGRVKDTEDYRLKTVLREIAETHTGGFRLSPSQNLIIASVAEEKKADTQSLINKYDLTDGKSYSGLRRNSMACVAFPTCGLAMAESERYLPTPLSKIEDSLDEAGVNEEEITIRMTGCPSGCTRPVLTEIAFIGKAPDKYNMYLGGSLNGDRLSKLYKESIDKKEILESLRPILVDYGKSRLKSEHSGDFAIRPDVVARIYDGRDFHG